MVTKSDSYLRFDSNFRRHPSLAVKFRLTLPYVELGERAGASVVVKWCRIRIVSGLFPNDALTVH